MKLILMTIEIDGGSIDSILTLKLWYARSKWWCILNAVMTTDDDDDDIQRPLLTIDDDYWYWSDVWRQWPMMMVVMEAVMIFVKLPSIDRDLVMTCKWYLINTTKQQWRRNRQWAWNNRDWACELGPLPLLFSIPPWPLTVLMTGDTARNDEPLPLCRPVMEHRGDEPLTWKVLIFCLIRRCCCWYELTGDIVGMEAALMMTAWWAANW